MSNCLEIDKLIDSDKNVYELTCVAIKEAAVISEDSRKIEEIDAQNEKVVSVALNKVLDGEVEYSVRTQR